MRTVKHNPLKFLMAPPKRLAPNHSREMAHRTDGRVSAEALRGYLRDIGTASDEIDVIVSRLLDEGAIRA